MTKKVKSAGRYRCQYGRKIRQEVTDIEKVQKQKSICPVCRFQTVRRTESAIWCCTKCGLKFAGGMYQPQRIAEREAKEIEGGEMKRNV